MLKRVLTLACCLAVMLVLGGVTASAEVCPTINYVTACTIYDDNTTAVINANYPNNAYDPLPGVVLWNVDGVDYLFQQWFWFRIGEEAEQTIDTLNFFGAVTEDGHAEMETIYGIADRDRLLVALDFEIEGGSTPTLDEEIRITNTSFYARPIHFFQYVDFDLSEDDTAQMIDNNQVMQTGNGVIASETVYGPNFPDRHEVNQYPMTLEKLTDEGPSELSGQDWSDGDATWAFEWDFVLGPGETFVINKEKALSAVPEPASILLLGTALLFASKLRRKATV